MKRHVLDTSILIHYWHKRRSSSLADNTVADAEAWARDLIELRKTDAIVTPVYVEMVAGVASQHEMRLTRAYLGQFHCVDEGDIRPEDWQEAIRLAQRVPKDKKPRNLGDCLIRAIANRLHYSVDSSDKSFPS